MTNICKDCQLFHIEHKLDEKLEHVVVYCCMMKSPVHPYKSACKYYIENPKEKSE